MSEVAGGEPTMSVDGVEADYEECAVAVDGSVVWRNGVRYVPEASGRYCSYCDGTGIVPGSEGQVWARGVGWHWPEHGYFVGAVGNQP